MSNIAFDFSSSTVIVTGAGRGIGLEIGRAFEASGATTYFVDLDADVLKAAVEASDLARPISADVTRTEDVDRVVQKVIEDTGRIDVLVNNAGILRDRVVWKLEDSDWDAVLDVHLGGTFRFTRACVGSFRKANYGRIINVTSYTGLRGQFGQSNYSAAKAGIVGFTKTTAKELASFGITVNAISPNARTRMIDSIPEELRNQAEANNPMGRFADPAEMAAAVQFLASEEAGYITGTVLRVDGGVAI
jgi:3-oxoacyl-[acyl-carrier protein] reductase